MKNIILLLSIIFIFSCSDEKSNNIFSNEEEYFELKGKVLENGTYNPIPNVLIKTIPNSEIVISDENGEFSFVGLKNTEYLIYTESLDYYESYIAVNSKSSEKIEFLLNKSIEGNSAPSKPKIYNINNTVIDGKLNTYLSWFCEDDNEGNIYYDLLVDTENPPRKIHKKNITDKFTYIRNEDISNKYYYQIIARDEEGATSKSLPFEYVNQNERLMDKFETNEILRLSLDDNYFWYEKFGSYETYDSNSSYTLSDDRKFRKNKAAYYKSKYSLKNITTSLNLNEEFTISMWVKYDFLSENRVRAIFYRQSNISTNLLSFDLGVNVDGKISFYTYNNNNEINNILQSNKNIINNVWNNIVLTVKDNGVQLFINGQYESEISLFSTFFIGNALKIGTIEVFPNDYVGYLDDIIFFDKALRIDRVKDLYNN